MHANKLRTGPIVLGPLTKEEEKFVRDYFALTHEQRREIAGLPEHVVDAPEPYEDDEDSGMEVIGYVAAVLSGVLLTVLLMIFVF